MDWEHPTGNKPKIVDIVACGPTLRTYLAMRMDYDPVAPTADEVWTLNKALRTVKGDVGFVMDDMIGEHRRSSRYGEDLDDLSMPIITSTVDRDVLDMYPKLAPNLHPYPINEVLNQIGARILHARGQGGSVQLGTNEVKETGDIAGYYLHNSIPFMLAYALFLGVEKVQLFGADYTYPGMVAREDDRANTEYWVGMLRAFGVEVWTTSDTTLLNQMKQPHIYGYGARPPIRTWPTVEWLERQASDIWSPEAPTEGDL